MLDGQIIKGVGGLYTVVTHQGSYSCKARGIFRKHNHAPVIGDFVSIEVNSEKDREGTISVIKPRKNELLRPRVSNLDQVVITFAVVEPTINLDLLDRFIITAEHRNIPPVICFNKTDLCGQAEQETLSKLCRLYGDIGYPVACVSTATGGGLEELPNLLKGKVSAFAGPSGVGKSSIINALLPSAAMETGALSQKIKRGKHTTRHAQLWEAFEGSYIVDSPGFTTLSLEGLQPAQLPYLFKEFRPYISECRFSDCKHLAEPDCMVKAHVDVGISPARYQRYKAFLEETATNV